MYTCPLPDSYPVPQRELDNVYVSVSLQRDWPETYINKRLVCFHTLCSMTHFGLWKLWAYWHCHSPHAAWLFTTSGWLDEGWVSNLYGYFATCLTTFSEINMLFLHRYGCQTIYPIIQRNPLENLRMLQQDTLCMAGARLQTGPMWGLWHYFNRRDQDE